MSSPNTTPLNNISGPGNPYAVPGIEHGVPANTNAWERTRNALFAGAIVANGMVGGEATAVPHEITQTVEVTGMQPQTFSVETETGPKEITIALPGGVVNQLQSDYKTTAEDKEATTQQVSELIEQALPRSMWQYVIGVKSDGEASAEDKKGGLQAQNYLNGDLAKQRGELGLQAVRDIMGDSLKAADDKLEANGTEHDWLNDNVNDARDWAAQLGFEDEDALVAAYDRDPSRFSPEAVDFLKPLLDDHRGARISFTVLYPSETETQEVTVWIPVTTLEQHSHTETVTETSAIRQTAEVANTGTFVNGQGPIETRRNSVPLRGIRRSQVARLPNQRGHFVQPLPSNGHRSGKYYTRTGRHS